MGGYSWCRLGVTGVRGSWWRKYCSVIFCLLKLLIELVVRVWSTKFRGWVIWCRGWKKWRNWRNHLRLWKCWSSFILGIIWFVQPFWRKIWILFFGSKWLIIGESGFLMASLLDIKDHLSSWWIVNKVLSFSFRNFFFFYILLFYHVIFIRDVSVFTLLLPLSL